MYQSNRREDPARKSLSYSDLSFGKVPKTYVGERQPLYQMMLGELYPHGED
jgi:hypothetical protein